MSEAFLNGKYARESGRERRVPDDLTAWEEQEWLKGYDHATN